MTNTIEKLKPIRGEGRWVDYDEGTACWGVFGVDSGFCYTLHSDETLANEQLKEYEKTAVAVEDARIP